VTGQARATEARRLAIAAMLMVIDDRHLELPELLAGTDHEMLVVMNGGLAIFAGTIVQTMPPESRARLREQLGACALDMAGWPQ
jgi:hypothetical protein